MKDLHFYMWNFFKIKLLLQTKIFVYIYNQLFPHTFLRKQVFNTQ